MIPMKYESYLQTSTITVATKDPFYQVTLLCMNDFADFSTTTLIKAHSD